MPDRNQTVEVICPKCRNTQIISLPKEDLPKCPQCRVAMVIREVLTEGKSY